jgi:hypothetical protein
MKKSLPLIIGLLLVLTTWPVKAQETSPDQALKDYLHTYNQYQLAHRSYVDAQSAYLNYQTLTAKETARQKTLTMLQLRDEVVRTYLQALRIRALASQGIDDQTNQELSVRLINDADWFAQHHETLTASGSLEDLVKISDQAARQWEDTELLGYQALITILAGKQRLFQNQTTDIINQINTKLAAIRTSETKDTAALERWSLEAENRLTNSQGKTDEALAVIADPDNNLNRGYQEARLLIQESNQYLKEANSFLKEIIREVKIAD